MRKLENFHLLVMLILLVAVGQMAQTIYVPSIADMARDLGVRSAVRAAQAAGNPLFDKPKTVRCWIFQSA